jgi:tRNA(fMet)-specific endonuclease VapC
LEAATEDVATTIISAEEQFRGWLAQIRREHDPHKQITAYQRLGRRIEFFAQWNVLGWDVAAADAFHT